MSVYTESSDCERGSMLGNGSQKRGLLRANSNRSPPFVVVGLLIVIVVLAVNYWTLSTTADEHKETIRDLGRRLDQMGQAKQNLEDEKVKLYSDFKQKDADFQQKLDQKNEDWDKLTSQVKEMQAQLSKIKSDYEQKTTEYELCVKSQSEKNEEASEKAKQVSQLEAARSEAHNELDQLRKQHSSISAELQTLRKSYADMELENQRLKDAQVQMQRGEHAQSESDGGGLAGAARPITAAAADPRPISGQHGETVERRGESNVEQNKIGEVNNNEPPPTRYKVDIGDKYAQVNEQVAAPNLSGSNVSSSATSRPNAVQEDVNKDKDHYPTDVNKDKAQYAADVNKDNAHYAADVNKDNPHFAADVANKDRSEYAADVNKDSARYAADVNKDNAHNAADFNKDQAQYAADVNKDNPHFVADVKNDGSQENNGKVEQYDADVNKERGDVGGYDDDDVNKEVEDVNKDAVGVEDDVNKDAVGSDSEVDALVDRAAVRVGDVMKGGEKRKNADSAGGDDDGLEMLDDSVAGEEQLPKPAVGAVRQGDDGQQMGNVDDLDQDDLPPAPAL